MQGFVYIKDLFKSVLQCSEAIEGRFHISQRNGWEMNTDQVGEIAGSVSGNKYPLALMLPPFVRGNHIQSSTDWERYSVVVFFLKRTYNNSNGSVAAVNTNTFTSTHTVVEDWHDMHREAVGFIKALQKVVKDGMLMANRVRFVNEPQTIRPLSQVGSDLVSGVMLEMKLELPPICDLEGYNTEALNNIQLPSVDPHPIHSY